MKQLSFAGEAMFSIKVLFLNIFRMWTRWPKQGNKLRSNLVLAFQDSLKKFQNLSVPSDNWRIIFTENNYVTDPMPFQVNRRKIAMCSEVANNMQIISERWWSHNKVPHNAVNQLQWINVSEGVFLWFPFATAGASPVIVREWIVTFVCRRRRHKQGKMRG